MADQARDLNKMMGRYRIDESAAPTWVAAPQQRANVALAAAMAAPRVERRSASRPWSKAPKAAAAPAADAAGDTGMHKKAVGAATNDTDWQEF
jgi:hypothetical protein